MNLLSKYKSITLALAVTILGTWTASTHALGTDSLDIDLGTKSNRANILNTKESLEVEDICETPDWVIKHAVNYIIALFMALNEPNSDMNLIDELASIFWDAAIQCDEDPETSLTYVFTVLKQNEIVKNGEIGPYTDEFLENAIAFLYDGFGTLNVVTGVPIIREKEINLPNNLPQNTRPLIDFYKDDLAGKTYSAPIATADGTIVVPSVEAIDQRFSATSLNYQAAISSLDKCDFESYKNMMDKMERNKGITEEDIKKVEGIERKTLAILEILDKLKKLKSYQEEMIASAKKYAEEKKKKCGPQLY